MRVLRKRAAVHETYKKCNSWIASCVNRIHAWRTARRRCALLPIGCGSSNKVQRLDCKSGGRCLDRSLQTPRSRTSTSAHNNTTRVSHAPRWPPTTPLFISCTRWLPHKGHEGHANDSHIIQLTDYPQICERVSGRRKYRCQQRFNWFKAEKVCQATVHYALFAFLLTKSINFVLNKAFIV